jgi:hypothetical protein
VLRTGQAIAAGWLLIGGLLSQACAQGIFTCTDARGRRLTADRPITECMDREQKELSPGGLVRRKIGPSLTAEERAAEEAKARNAAEERARLAEEKKRQRALLARYPDRAAHDKERAVALAQADGVITTARERLAELALERKRLVQELEFFNGDSSRASPKLKRQLEENGQHTEAQNRFVAAQVAELKRINARYDEELGQLRPSWAQRAAPAAAAKPQPSKPSAAKPVAANP